MTFCQTDSETHLNGILINTIHKRHKVMINIYDFLGRKSMSSWVNSFFFENVILVLNVHYFLWI